MRLGDMIVAAGRIRNTSRIRRRGLLADLLRAVDVERVIDQRLHARE
jgi:hypothetical protein